MLEIQRYKALQVRRANYEQYVDVFAAVYFSYLFYGNNTTEWTILKCVSV